MLSKFYELRAGVKIDYKTNLIYEEIFSAHIFLLQNMDEKNKFTKTIIKPWNDLQEN